MSDDQDTDAHSVIEVISDDVADGDDRPKYATYFDYNRAMDRSRKPYLEDQPGILSAILFNANGYQLWQNLRPGDFSRRTHKDFNDEVGMLQSVSETVFNYIEINGRSPGNAIFDLVSKAGELDLIERLEHLNSRLEKAEAEAASKYKRFERSWHEDDDRPVPDDRSWEWRQLEASIEGYLQEKRECEIRASRPKRTSHRQKRKAKQHQVLLMLQEGRSRREIMQVTGYSASRISQIASAVRD